MPPSKSSRPSSPRPGRMPEERPRVLVTGATGMLGIGPRPGPRGRRARGCRAAPVRPRRDRAPKVSRGAFRDVRPQVVVNCAAFTRVDACETDRASFEVNARGGRLSGRRVRAILRAARPDLDRLRFRRSEGSSLHGGGRARPALRATAGGSAPAKRPLCDLPSRSSCARRGSSAAAGGTSSRRSCGRSRRGSRRLPVVDDQRGGPRPRRTSPRGSWLCSTREGAESSTSPTAER